jgi:predicted RecB family nuclease
MTPDAEQELFLEFWRWLTGLRRAVLAGGNLLRAYCYNAGAENSQLRRNAAGTWLEDEVGEFIGSGDWIDLMRVLDDQIITGDAIGLKNVAALAGFGWEVPDPGGATALAKYEAATSAGEPAAAREARQWLLAYNRGDVMATRALRDWLDEAASGCPSVRDAGRTR